MEKNHQDTRDKGHFDISIIRPQMRDGDIFLRGQDMSSARLRAIKKGLLTLHNLEGMAVNIYRFQITKRTSEHNRQLIVAMCNEMTHLQDFEVKLFEYGWRPSKLRCVYLMVGFVLGFFSRLMGTRQILKTGIWVETKAVYHYDELLRTIDWDNDTSSIVAKNQADEYGHIARWKQLSESINISGRA